MYSGEIDRAYAAAEQAVAALAALPTHRMTATELLGARARHERLLRLLVAADREPLARLVERGTDDFGGGALKAILADRLRITRTEAGRRLAQAAELASRILTSGQDVPPVLPLVAEAEARGAIGTEHVQVIRTFLHHLPETVDAQERSNAERDLVGYAEYLRPDQLQRCAEHLAALLNPDGEFSDRDRARKRSFTMRPQGPDKMRSGRFCADPELAAYLEVIFAKLAAPGMCHPDDMRPVVDGRSDGDGPDRDAAARDTRTPGQRRHDALSTLCRDSLASGRLGSHRGLPVTVIATATIGELQRYAGIGSGSGPVEVAEERTDISAPPADRGYATTGGGSLLPIRDLIRMAGRALPYLCMFDDDTGRPLYFGRATRLATPDQRLVLHATDRGCTYPSCPAPGYICETHHVHEWADGGNTDITNLTFVCPAHHRLVGTDPTRWRTTKSRAGRTQWTPPHHVDPTATPRISSYHHADDHIGNPTGPAAAQPP
ncbi:HNH endonuclease signature motif containing protein [Millisia brevis]|uniref:HNH endonuclease signature motif containing protein n=1 Tax=Millisia brevis TaxID=264148 RepID=UPI00082DD1D3|nr:HNH endonuclease signature motif containing protein [Millisia brevis]